ncbi:diacylglycerol kinase family protein [Pseudogracilibacillus sp. SO30301A]|uniref:diacylglycerol kinase family protein n=1 Tax=Pseudogracilibacillus sp. SO30301A TaxID=3098291 RepID=UPI00300E2391
MEGNGKRGIGLEYALNGLKEAFIRERNFRIHLFIATIVIITGFYFRLKWFEWIFIIIMIQTVLITELINSLIERIIDYIKPELHPKAKIIKDISAGAVLVAAITSIIVGLIIFIPKIVL